MIMEHVLRDIVKDQAALNVYWTLMKWLEGKTPSTRGDILEIPVKTGGEEAEVKTLRFRRVATMGGGGYVESLDKDGTRIPYDQNWESLFKIEELIKG